MTPRDFCYWLQGRLELGKGEYPLNMTMTQVDVIQQHLRLALSTKVDMTRYPDSNKGLSFCHWLAGLLTGTTGALSEETVRKIQDRLSQAFVEEIDPTFDNGGHLNEIHNGAATGYIHDADRPAEDDEVEALC